MVPVPEIGPEDTLESVLKYSIGRREWRRKDLLQPKSIKIGELSRKFTDLRKGKFLNYIILVRPQA